MLTVFAMSLLSLIVTAYCALLTFCLLLRTYRISLIS